MDVESGFKSGYRMGSLGSQRYAAIPTYARLAICQDLGELVCERVTCSFGPQLWGTSGHPFLGAGGRTLVRLGIDHG